MSRRRTSGERAGSEATVVTDTVATQLLHAVDRAVETRWIAAQERARSVDGDRDTRVEAVTEKIRRELGLAGAVSGGTAAVPGVGLGAVAASFAVELTLSTMRLADLILTIAAIHGHDRAEIEERRLWVLSILTYRDGAAGAVAKLAAELAESPAKRGARQLTRRSIRQINSSIGASVVAKYGGRRLVAALGRAIPFGVGAVLGYGMNTRAVTMTSKHAHGFFTDFPISLAAIDTDGQIIEREPTPQHQQPPPRATPRSITPPRPDPATHRG
ncbi:MAG: EcsC family protein [Ilumatobacter sp.]